YKIVECGMKFYPIEALSHSPTTATLKLVHEHNIKPEDVAEIRVETIARAADILSDPAKYRPTSKETADHSLPYCLAVAIADREVTPNQFKHERIIDPKLHPLMDAVKAVAHPEFEALFPAVQPSRVTITTKGGRSYAQRVDVPKGDYRDPGSMDDIEVKFNALAGDVFSQKQLATMKDAILSLESCADVSTLMRMFVAE
ncbi:MAG: MmgE/PrpD family protein, partial [Planctomycetota bacterium]